MFRKTKRLFVPVAFSASLLILSVSCTFTDRETDSSSQTSPFPIWQEEEFGRTFRSKNQQHPYAVEWDQNAELIRLVGKATPDVDTGGTVVIKIKDKITLRNAGFEPSNASAQTEVPASFTIPVILRQANENQFSARVTPVRRISLLSRWHRDVLRDNVFIQVVDELEFKLGKREDLQTSWFIQAENSDIELQEVENSPRKVILSTGTEWIEFEFSRPVLCSGEKDEAQSWKYVFTSPADNHELKAVVRVRESN